MPITIFCVINNLQFILGDSFTSDFLNSYSICYNFCLFGSDSCVFLGLSSHYNNLLISFKFHFGSAYWALLCHFY